jgi:pyruvate,water dikinase
MVAFPEIDGATTRLRLDLARESRQGSTGGVLAMTWLQHLFGSQASAAATLQALQARFGRFLSLLENNHRVLKVISDMEEKARGEYLFDLAYIRNSLDLIESGLDGMIADLVAVGGERYGVLRPRLKAIGAEITARLSGRPALVEDRLTIPLGEFGRERAPSVGSKTAQLGELKGKLGLPVPDGFAISAWAYKLFLEVNGLRESIDARLRALDVRCHDDLVRASEAVQGSILAAKVPEDLAEALLRDALDIERRTGAKRFALRSSAIGEDTAFSFAGQYASYLNLASHELVDAYRRIVASKFTPQAIYYLLSHALLDSDTPMAVGCIAMVDARAAGVIYTVCPVNPAEQSIVIHAVRGLGKLLVDGTLTPDVFRVDRATGRLREAVLARKPVRLRASTGGGVEQVAVSEAEQCTAAISEAEARTLAQYARAVEAHYGAPQDIEWAIDERGQCFLLQARPLRLVAPEPAAAPAPTQGLEALLAGGSTACPGAGAGAVFHARSVHDLAAVPAGAVLVARDPVPGLVTVMGKVSAIVTCVGGVASHMATLAREYRVATLVGLEDAFNLPAGREVTVDATGRTIYAGLHPALVEARRPGTTSVEDNPVIALLASVLQKVAPLSLLHPADPDFKAERCTTYHDLTRYAHQKAMEAMFATAREMDDLSGLGLRLQSGIPLRTSIISVDQDLSRFGRGKGLTIEAIDSPPLASFWGGVMEEGWPSLRAGADIKGFAALIASTAAGADNAEFCEDSFAIVGREYLLASLRMGYHFSTIEAIASPETSKNYVRIQFKGGGTLQDRRLRRVSLITRVLDALGFESHNRGDFLDARASYEPASAILDKLRVLGRLTIMTKQLDIALSNDAVAQWYANDFIKKLGLEDAPGRP